MKKILFITLILLFITTLPCQAFLKVEAHYTAYSNESGCGYGLNFPLIPFLDTTIFYTPFADRSLDIANVSFNYQGESFNSSTKVKASAIELQIKPAFEFAGVMVGATGVYNFLYGKNTTGKYILLPGDFYAGPYGQLRIPLIIPFTSFYGQIGYLFKFADGEKALKDKVGVDIDLNKMDLSGFYYRVGAAIGF